MDEQRDREDELTPPAEPAWGGSREPPQAGRSEVGPIGSGPMRARPGVWTAVLAWVVIVATVAFVVASANLQEEGGSEQSGAIELVMMELQSKYLVGLSQLPVVSTSMDPAVIYQQAEDILDTGSVGQRLRFIVLAQELGGPEVARERLEDLDELLADPPRGDPVELTEAEASIREALYALSSAGADGGTTAQPPALAEGDRQLLVDELGWFGRLALAPPGTQDQAGREAALRSARTVAMVFLGMFGLAGLAALGGFVGLVVLLVMVLRRALRGGLRPQRAHHAVYAETFALWLVLFMVLQVVAGRLSPRPWHMTVSSIAVLSSLVALVWPAVRGVSWRDVRHDIGWTAGRRPWLEPLLAVAGYVMTLPLLVVGVMMTLFLVFVQSQFGEPPPTFAPSGGPAHPIILALTGDSWWPKIQVLLLAAVVAPLVEETMFRGVLYRHLRSATARAGMATSVILSTTINGFLFAVIHPQGWVTVPALMSLAYGFALMREWRDSVLPSMLMHGLSNGVVISVLIVVLGV